eukprot:9662603-Karenia_brevis.AAC.1
MENKFEEVRRRNRRERKARLNGNVCRDGCDDKGCCEDRWVCTVGNETQSQGKKMSINFQVAAVSKPLLAVKRIVEKGNH